MYVIYQGIVAGRLIPVLSQWRLPELTINIAFQTRHYIPIKNRLFIEFLVDHFTKQGYEKLWNASFE